MKRDICSLLKIAAVNSIQSLVPVLTWVLLAVSFNDTRYSDGFMITYPFQFIAEVIYFIVFKGQLKGEIKKSADNHNVAYTGIKLLVIIYTILFIISYACRVEILTYMNISIDNVDVFLFGVAQIFMDWVLYGIVTVDQYDLKDAKAFRTVLFWYLSKLVCVAILGRSHNHASALVFLCVYMLFLLVVIISRKCKQTKFMFSIKDGFKYSLYDIPQATGMAIIYLFGVSDMYYRSAVIISAYNIMSICTDVQWDVLHSAIYIRLELLK